MLTAAGRTSLSRSDVESLELVNAGEYYLYRSTKTTTQANGTIKTKVREGVAHRDTVLAWGAGEVARLTMADRFVFLSPRTLAILRETGTMPNFPRNLFAKLEKGKLDLRELYRVQYGLCAHHLDTGTMTPIPYVMYLEVSSYPRAHSSGRYVGPNTIWSDCVPEAKRLLGLREDIQDLRIWSGRIDFRWRPSNTDFQNAYAAMPKTPHRAGSSYNNDIENMREAILTRDTFGLRAAGLMH